MKNRKLKDFIGNIIRKVIPDVKRYEYALISASRTVIKSLDGKTVRYGGFYDTDIWSLATEKLKNKVFNSYTLYYELVGWAGNKMVQKDYDYLCSPGEFKILIYRITQTIPTGEVLEYSWDEIEDFCREHNLQTVPVFYRGTIKDWMIKHVSDGETFLDSLKRIYLEKNCEYCIKKVPSEGICIRNESGNKIAYKLKSRAFLLKETAELDKGGEVIE
jgi:hypothetical protein